MYEEDVRREYRIDYVAIKIHRNKLSYDKAHEINSRGGWYITGCYVHEGRVIEYLFNGPLSEEELQEAIKRAEEMTK
jgi:hypothetical protein